MPGPAAEKVVLDQEDLRRALVRIAHEIVERNADDEQIALIGIHRRGVPLAARLQSELAGLLPYRPQLGSLDIAFYRDDFGQRADAPIVNSSQLDFPIDGGNTVIVDDVLFTGRTVRAAIDALFDYGRPARVQLAVMIDRGHRELPIRPDYVGKNLPTSLSERVNVRLTEIDDTDEVTIAAAKVLA